jgi:GAF domain-containing protein
VASLRPQLGFYQIFVNNCNNQGQDQIPPYFEDIVTSSDKTSMSGEAQIMVENWPLGLAATREQLAKAKRRLEQYRAAIRLATVEVQQRNRGIVALTNFAYHGGRLTTPAALLRFALTQALSLIEAPVGAIVLIQSETRELTLGVHKGLTVELKDILIGRQLGNGALALMPHLVAGKGALLERHPTTEIEERRLLASNQLASLVSLPIQTSSKLSGAFLVGLQDDKYFAPADLCFLMAITQETTFMLDNLRLREGLWFTAKALLNTESIELELEDPDVVEVDLPFQEMFDLPIGLGTDTKPGAQDIEQLLMATVEANETVKQQNSDLQTLNTIAEILNRTLDLAEILQRTVIQIKIALHCDAAWLYLLDKEDGALELKVHAGLSAAYSRGMQRLKPGEGIEGLVLIDKKPHFSASIANDVHKHKIWVDKEGLMALAAVPITRPEWKDKSGHIPSYVIGVLGVGHRTQQSYQWSAREIRLLTAIANQMAPAIDNAQLYAKAQERETGFSVGNEILRAINDMLLEKNAFFEDFIQEDMLIALKSATQILQRLIGDEVNLTKKYDLATLEEIVTNLMVMAHESKDINTVLDIELKQVIKEKDPQHQIAKPIRLTSYQA